MRMRIVSIGLVVASISLRAAAMAACADPSLDVLLTNDDGFDRPGIQALRTALAAAGERVTLVAPAHDSSGTSTSVTVSKPIAVRKVEEGVYSVDATPATAVLWATHEVFPEGKAPALVVSGTNEGANVGAATPASGTVGATIAAITLLPRAVPGIAFSTNLMEKDALSEANRKHFADVAAFAARLVKALAEQACGKPLLPSRIALNVNYPGKPPEGIRGVKLARQGRKLFADISFRSTEPGVYVPVFAPSTGDEDRPDSDAVLLAQGYVTISVLDGDYSVDPGAAGLSAVLKRLVP